MSENDSIEPQETAKVPPREEVVPDPATAKEMPSPVIFFNKDFTPFGSPTEADQDTALYDFRPKDPDDLVLVNGEAPEADLTEEDFPKDSSALESAGSSESTGQMELDFSANQATNVPAEKDNGQPKESESGQQTSSPQATAGKNEQPASA